MGLLDRQHPTGKKKKIYNKNVTNDLCRLLWPLSQEYHYRCKKQTDWTCWCRHKVIKSIFPSSIYSFWASSQSLAYKCFTAWTHRRVSGGQLFFGSHYISHQSQNWFRAHKARPLCTVHTARCGAVHVHCTNIGQEHCTGSVECNAPQRAACTSRNGSTPMSIASLK